MYKYILLIAALIFVSAVLSDDTVSYQGVIWDHHPSLNINFEGLSNGLKSGMVKSTLGADKIPVLSTDAINNPGDYSLKDTSTFSWFWKDNAKNWRLPFNFTLTRNASTGYYEFKDESFFPIDNKLYDTWPNMTRYYDSNEVYHNYHFCFAIHSTFTYNGQKTFNFKGDDDVFVFINNVLRVDLGGVHGAQSSSVNVNQLGLKTGTNYDFDFYFCERHTTRSNCLITTDLETFCGYYDFCGVCNGKGDCCTAASCSDGDSCTVDSCPAPNTPAPYNCTHKPVSINYNPVCQKLDGSGSTCKVTNITCTPTVPGCYQPATCDPVNGCTFLPLDCDSLVTNKCTQDGVCNTSTGKCSVVAKTTVCPPLDCHSGTCNANNGSCTYVKTSNLCDNCTQDIPLGGCQVQKCVGGKPQPPTSTCVPSTPCIKSSCVNNTCQTVNLCNDNNLCTADSCVNNSTCNFAPITCDDANPCTVDSCSFDVGCVYTAVSCVNETDLCNTYSCDKVKGGCVPTPKVCTAPNCYNPICDPTIGCTYTQKYCENPDPDCKYAYCDKDTGKCATKDLDPKPFKCQSSAVKAGIISGAAIGGIVVGAAVAVAIMAYGGKKGYDHWKNTRNNKIGTLNNNPLFEEKVVGQGTNPLFQA